jgi:hypothetical protein
MKSLCLALMVALAPSVLYAGGLTTTFGDVLVEDLPLGAPYSMEQVAKTPLVIVNTSDQEVNLKLEVLAPQPEELKEGFEIIPDVNWIQLQHAEFVVAPGQSAQTDVVITVTDDDAYLGKHYQVYIWSHTTGRAIGVGLKSRLLLTVRQKRA